MHLPLACQWAWVEIQEGPVHYIGDFGCYFELPHSMVVSEEELFKEGR